MPKGPYDSDERHDRGEIGGAEFFSQALALCVSGSLLWGAAEKLAGGAFWLAILTAAAVGLFWPLLLACWGRLFAGLGFGEALCYGFGRAAGRVLLFAYAGFWLVLAGAALSYGVSFWSSLGANNAPLWLYAASFCLTAAVFGAAGVVPLARVSLLVAAPALLLALGNMGLTVFGADMGNWLPAFTAEQAGAAVPAGVELGVLVFGGLSALLPEFKLVGAAKRRWRTLLGAEIMAAAVWLAFAGVSLAVLGASVELYEFPVLQVFRLAEVGRWFSRFEVIGAVLLTSVVLLRAAALFRAACSCLTELWRWPGKSGLRRLALALGLGTCVFGAYTAGFLADRLQLFWLVVAFSMLAPVAAICLGARRLRRDSMTIIVKHEIE